MHHTVGVHPGSGLLIHEQEREAVNAAVKGAVEGWERVSVKE